MPSFFNRLWLNFKEYIVLVILLVTSLVILSQSQKPQVQKVRTFAFGTFAIVTSSVSAILEPFRTSFENMRLRETNTRLMLEVNRLREYGMMNEELKRMLSLKDTINYPLVPARIVSKYISNTQGNFIINVGSVNGIKPGMPVINDQGLIGIARSVSEDFTLVRTLNNRELRFAVKNQRSRFDGIVEWNGSNLIIKNVPKTYDMEVGDRIITSDFSTKFPPSIPIGVVSGGTKNTSGIFNNITVSPFVDFVKIENVFVINFIPSVQKNNLELNLISK